MVIRRGCRYLIRVTHPPTPGNQGPILLLPRDTPSQSKRQFLIDEFRARIRALIRRGGAQRSEQVVCGNVVLNRLTRQLFIHGVEVSLTAKELPLLEHLMLHRNEVITRSELLERVWDMHFDPGSNVVDVNVARIRRKLSDAGADIRIGARRGMGFILSPADAPPA